MNKTRTIDLKVYENKKNGQWWVNLPKKKIGKVKPSVLRVVVSWFK